MPGQTQTLGRPPCCGTALGFRNLTNYITRSLVDTGVFRPRLLFCDEPVFSFWGCCRDAYVVRARHAS